MRPLNILIQVNIDNDDNKSGCAVAQLPQLAELVDNSRQLHLRGLMAIPAKTDSFDAATAIFREIKGLL